MRLGAALVVAAVLWVAGGALAQGLPTLAVAPFWDLSADGVQVDAERMNRDLSRLLVQTARFHVVSPERVGAAMRSLGFLPPQLFHPARARELSQAVGADWLVVGRWTHLDRLDGGDGDPDLPRPRGGGVVAVLDVWVWARGGTRPKYEATFNSFRPAVGGPLGLREAAEEVLRKVAAALSRL
ncbi:MAG: hypothetical protein RMM30_07745 [Armatimonadota bacterium]|nr:hypothetical protein [Armatimonadota bacterium]MDW8156458.1 hypothetical protein [Armatimonadota bacterium]